MTIDANPPENPPAFNLTDVDRQVLAQTDDEFILHDWEDLKSIIARNDLALLKRKPSELRRYLAWSHATKQKYGSITNYICQERLHWSLPDTHHDKTVVPPITTDSGPVFPYNNPTPFADPADYKILRNDWPYGLAPGITHLVVWLRTPVAVNEADGDLTPESRALVEGFVLRTFVGRLAAAPEAKKWDDSPRDHVLWFKNWTALQSVRSLEHVHVLVRDVPEKILVEWTGEGPPMH
ncbi:GIG1 family protein [Aspergillus saccharolyticus JOP 1030-1]|uniref:N-acetylglucosamine-induced protein 1 n=1 Tax=Aspergillus saccharolyticus JOP 1030-1 TaxID=1450539 RepID=A0A318ZR80_9EURO|nr:hypothetical protein BP01DRAFT_352675 [Aspergillus saccharolyticus JOP 1030-1]PYH49155.1 hypothetical protein BP01DRAFT_352675 [Aspergillus saccharolyticus JOP 1030-1]